MTEANSYLQASGNVIQTLLHFAAKLRASYFGKFTRTITFQRQDQQISKPIKWSVCGLNKDQCFINIGKLIYNKYMTSLFGVMSVRQPFPFGPFRRMVIETRDNPATLAGRQDQFPVAIGYITSAHLFIGHMCPV